MRDLGRTVVYQIYPRSFQDSNGNGIGDLCGITSRLDYLADLGVDLLWLTPIFVSPQNDNGYDVADYCSIDPLFGTMEDFDTLVAEARKHGMGLMLDMVFNHTSTEHKWFQYALEGDEYYQKFYYFVDGKTDEEGNPGLPPTNWVSKFGGPAWQWIPELNKWYLHLFDPTQADLNWSNPAVRNKLKEIIRFWRTKGVEGFRFDVVNLISKPAWPWQDDYEGDGRRFYTDGPHVHEYLRELALDTGLGEMITVGEMSSTSIENCIGYSNPANHELSMVFSFHHLKVDYDHGEKWALKDADINQLRNLFRSWQEAMAAGGGWNALFWDNHDQPRAVSRFGCDSDYKLWHASAKMLATCIFFMRGTPYIYQGNELGMTNAYFDSIADYRDIESLNYYKILIKQGLDEKEALHIIAERSRDNGRTPMQWNASPNAGFTTYTPWIGIPANHEHINVENERTDAHSPWMYYQKLIALRHQLDVIADGDIKFIELAGQADKIIAFRRDLETAAAGQPQHMLILCSFASDETQVVIPEQLAKEIQSSAILISAYAYAPSRKKSLITLKPYDAVVYAW